MNMTTSKTDRKDGWSYFGLFNARLTTNSCPATKQKLQRWWFRVNDIIRLNIYLRRFFNLSFTSDFLSSCLRCDVLVCARRNVLTWNMQNIMGWLTARTHHRCKLKWILRSLRECNMPVALATKSIWQDSRHRLKRNRRQWNVSSFRKLFVDKILDFIVIDDSPCRV